MTRVDRALDQPRFNLVLASDILSSPAVADRLQCASSSTPFERRSGFSTAVRVDGQGPVARASPCRAAQAPPNLVAQVRTGAARLRAHRARGARRIWSIGGRVPSGSRPSSTSSSRRRQLFGDLVQLANDPAGRACDCSSLLAGLVGRARRPAGACSGRPGERGRAVARRGAPRRRACRSGGRDEFGAWAASFNEMADASRRRSRPSRRPRLASGGSPPTSPTSSGRRSRRSSARPRSSATTSTQMPPEARRAGRACSSPTSPASAALVEDLMEISRLDAGREAFRVEAVDLASLVEGDHPGPRLDRSGRVDGGGVVGRHATAAGSSGSSRTSSATPSSTAATGRSRPHRERDGVGAIADGSGPGARHRRRSTCPTSSIASTRPTRRAPAPGSGLGLAIALENARLLGGDIEVCERGWSRQPVHPPLADLRCRTVTERQRARCGRCAG